MFPDTSWAGVAVVTTWGGVNTPPRSAVNAPRGGASMGGPIWVSNLSRALFGTTLSDPSHLRLYVYVDDDFREERGGVCEFWDKSGGELRG